MKLIKINFLKERLGKRQFLKGNMNKFGRKDSNKETKEDDRLNGEGYQQGDRVE